MITITPTAEAFLEKSLTLNAIGIRLGVKDGGCSGYKYTIEPATERSSEDHVFNCDDGLMILVDQKSFPFLDGMIVDCVTEGVNKVIKFINPNEKAACGCGQSFSA